MPKLVNYASHYARLVANSPWLLMATFSLTILGATLAYMVSEGEDFLNALYWALVTATTLGYGDFSPHTVAGKVLTSGLITFTVFVMIPTITANVASWLIVNRDAFTDSEQEEIKATLQECLALLRQRPSDVDEPPAFLAQEVAEAGVPGV